MVVPDGHAAALAQLWALRLRRGVCEQVHVMPCEYTACLLSERGFQRVPVQPLGTGTSFDSCQRGNVHDGNSDRFCLETSQTGCDLTQT